MTACAATRRAGVRWAAAFLVLACAAVARRADAADLADWNWLRDEGTAALVSRPGALPGLTLWTIESPRHRGAITAMDVAPDGKRVATGGIDGIVRIWNLETGELDRAFIGHRYGIYVVAWSPEGSLLASHAGADSTTRVWDVDAGRERKRFTEWGWIGGLAWSRDGRKLAAWSGGSGSVYVSDALGTPKRIAECGKPVRAGCWSPDGGRLAVAVADSPVSLLDAGSGMVVGTLGEDGDGVVTALRWSGSGTSFAVASRKAVTLWEPDGSKIRTTIAVPAETLAWSPDDGKLLVGSGGGMQIFPAESSDAARSLQRFAPAGPLAAWNSPTDRIVAVSADRIDVFQPDGTKVRSIDAGASAAPVFKPGKPIATGIGTKMLALWDPKSFARLRQLEGHSAPVTVAAWSRDGRRLATGDEAGGIRIWTVGEETEPRACQAHKTRITGLAWSADGTQLASRALRDNVARLWTEDGDEGGALEGHGKPVLALAWAPSGKSLATGGADEQVLVWETAPVARQRAIEFVEPVQALAWSSAKGGLALACVLGDGVIQVVGVANGKPLASLEDRRSAGAVTDAAVAWLPGARPAVLTARSQLVQVWDADEAKSVDRLMAPGGASAAAVVAGGAVVQVRANDRTVRFHGLRSGQWGGALLDEGGMPIAIGVDGQLKHAADETPALIAIVETKDGQRTMPLDEFAKTHGWKAGGKGVALPMKE